MKSAAHPGTARSLDVLPHWATTEGAPAWTRLGTIGSAAHGRIDPKGLVNLAPGGPSLEWWVGAEDRWHVPVDSASVRQGLLRACPVVETRMRVPGGDIVHRAFAIHSGGPGGGRSLLIVEIENSSAVPVALALAVRPYDLSQMGTTRHLELDDMAVRADGEDLLYLPRPPQHTATSTAAVGDVAATVFAGDARGADIDVTCPDGLAQAALVFPLAHTASLTVALPLSDSGAGGLPTAVPTAEQVVRGWVTQSDRGMRLVLPDDRLQSAVDANRRYLLSFAAGVDIVGASTERAGQGRARPLVDVARLITALDRYGFHDEARELLAPFAAMRLPRRIEPDQRRGYATLISALAAHHDLCGPPPPTLVPNLAAAIQLIHDAGRPGILARWRPARGRTTPEDTENRRMARAMHDGARLLRAAGEDGAAQTADRFAASTHAGDDGEGDRAAAVFGAVDSLLAAASPTWTWPTPTAEHRTGTAGGTGADGHAPAVAADFLTHVRDLLVSVTEPGLDLLPVVPRAWFGRGLEVHDAPTPFGALSYALRWHGERPALLWELQSGAGLAPVVLTCSGLDPGWTSTEPRGETLLAAPAS